MDKMQKTILIWQEFTEDIFDAEIKRDAALKKLARESNG